VLGPGSKRAPLFATCQSSQKVSPLLAHRTVRKGSAGCGGLCRSSETGAQGHLHQVFLRACRPMDDEITEFWLQQQYGAPRAWVEFQNAALRWEMHRGNVGRVGAFYSGLLKEQLSQNDSGTASPNPTSPTALNSRVASTRADLALVGHGRLSRAHDGADNHNHMVTQHFNISVDDWLEVEEEFFPEDRRVINCS